MEPELYDYENSQGEDYSEDDWYYRPGMPGGPPDYDLDEDNDYPDEYYEDEDDVYEPNREV